MSVERKRAAGWLGGAAAAGAAGIVAAFCCAPAAAVAGAGVAATGGILRNPWLISAGILIVALLAIAALGPATHRRRRELLPANGDRTGPAAEKETQALLGSHRVTADAGPASAGTNRTGPARAISARSPSPGRPGARTGPVPPATDSSHPGVASPVD